MFDIILLVHVITGQGTIGEIYVVENGSPFYFKDGNVLWFKTLKFVVPKFLRFILMAFVENLKRLSHGAAYNALPIEKLKNHLIYFPQSLDVQESIVNKFDALSNETKRLENIYQQKQNDLEELKKSNLQKAFGGELKMDNYQLEYRDKLSPGKSSI